MATMAHVEQNTGIKQTLTIYIEDPCKKSTAEISLAELENKAIDHSLASPL